MWSINIDSRAQRTIREMSINCLVDVYTVVDEGEIIDLDLYSDNVKFYRIADPVEYSFQNRLVNKIINHTFFYLNHKPLTSFVLSKKINYDIIFAHDLPSAYPALKIAKRLGAKIMYDVHDLYIETINQQFPLNSKGMKKIIYGFTIRVMRFLGRSFERKFVKHTSIIFAPTQSCLEYLEEAYEFDKGILFRNFPELKVVEKSSILKETLRLNENDSIVLYHGNLGRGRSLEFMVRSAKYFEKGNKLVIIGNGALEQELELISKEQNTTDQVYFMRSIEYNNLFKYVSGATLGIMLLESINKSKEYALANKITEYMACGVVPVLSNHVEHKRLVKDNNAGFIYEGSKHPEEFGAFINSCLKSPDQVREMSKVASNCYTTEFNWSKEKIHFIEPFNNLLNSIE